MILRRTVPAAILLALTAIPPFATAQTVGLGGPGAQGCQNSDDPPTLSDGTLANAEVHYAYDDVAKQLTLTVTNTTNALPGHSTPLITQVGFNLPASVTGTSLVSQTGSGGASPNWNLSQGPAMMACFGTFSRTLSNPSGIHNGIAKPGTDIPGPPGAAVLGPATFVIGIATAATLTAQDFIDALSTNPPGSFQTSTAVKFMGSGPNGAGSGFLGAGPECTDLASSVDLGPACNLPLDPVLSANPPVTGQLWTMSMTADSSFANALILWFASLPPVTPWTDPVSGCTVYVDVFNPPNFILINTFFSDANGDWSIQIPLPDLPALVGLELIFQLRICAPNGPQGPLDPDWLTNGLSVKIGCI